MLDLGMIKKGKPYYGPYDAQELLVKYEDEIGIKMVPFKMMVYVSEKNKYYEINNVPKNYKSLNISGTEFRQKLENGDDIPDWFSYPEVVKQLRTAYPEKTKQGLHYFSQDYLVQVNQPLQMVFYQNFWKRN